jgi:hypothetical protein
MALEPIGDEREEVDEESQGTRQDPHRMANQPIKRDPKNRSQKTRSFSSFFFSALGNQNGE